MVNDMSQDRELKFKINILLYDFRLAVISVNDYLLPKRNVLFPADLSFDKIYFP
jgi:hypothetical protein